MANNVQINPGRGMGHGAMLQKKVRVENPGKILKRILGYMGAMKWLLGATFVLCAFSVGVDIIATRINGYAIDSFIMTGDKAGLGFVCAVMVGIYGFGVVTTFVQNRLMVKTAQATTRSIRSDLFCAMQLLPIGFYDANSSGDLMSRATNDIDNINVTLSQSITQLFMGIVSIAGMSVAMVVLNPILFLAGMTTLPLVLLLSRLVIKKAQPYFLEQQNQLGRINGYIEEHIAGQKLVILFNKQEKTLEQFAKENAKLRQSAILSQSISGMLGPVNNLVNNLTYFIIAITGALLYLSNQDITIGVIFTFVIYMRSFVRPVNQLMNTFNSVQSALAGAKRVFDIIDEPGEKDEGKVDEGTIKGEVSLRDVVFSYPNGKVVLKGLSLEAHPGKVTAIVGPTGSGKTTIVNLLNRFYDCQSGTITIDSRPIKDYSLNFLRKNIAMVLQDTFLFEDTIERNISYGNPAASQGDIVAAAKMANADTFISHLPLGYKTVLVDNGANLSQGQRQLIAIARSVLCDSKILILDEATSSIDTKTEQMIQDAMVRLMAGKTTFIIAHRLNTIINADEIIVLNEGEIIEQGDHEELLKREGFYATLCNSQSLGMEI